MQLARQPANDFVFQTDRHITYGKQYSYIFLLIAVIHTSTAAKVVSYANNRVPGLQEADYQYLMHIS